MAGTVSSMDRIKSTVFGVPPWTGMTLINSWSNALQGTVSAKYRFWPLLNEVEVIGVITGGNITNGNAFTNVPFAFASIQVVQVQITSTSGAAPAQDPQFQAQTNGALQVQNFPTGTTTFAFHGWISIDA